MSLSSNLIQLLLPRGGYILNLVECYFDESESDGILCVAGYLFEKDSCIAMAEKWQQVLDEHHLAYFHMVECAHGNKQFKDKSKDERIDIQSKLIDLIKSHAEQGYAASFELEHAHLMPQTPRHVIDITNPYTLCCHLCLLGARHWAERTSYSGKISYVFESGHRSAADSNAIMNTVFAHEDLRQDFRYSSHTFGDKRQFIPLQAADILAWQWRKRVKDELSGVTRPRADFLSLIERPQHLTNHADEKFITGYYQATEGLSCG